MELLEVNGCDTRVLDKGSTLPHPLERPKDYAIQWRNQSLCFDFMRSVAPDKLLYDSEWHSLQTIKY